MKTREISLYAVFIALTCLGTLVIQIPFPLTKGYLNLGDTVLLAAGLLMGRRAGFLAGGLGSFLADFLVGYPYALATLVIKGVEGYLCGMVFEKVPTMKGRVLAVVIGAITMAFGYFFFECFLVGPATAAISLLANLGQGAAGAILGYSLSVVLDRIFIPRHAQ